MLVLPMDQFYAISALNHCLQTGLVFFNTGDRSFQHFLDGKRKLPRTRIFAENLIIMCISQTADITTVIAMLQDRIFLERRNFQSVRIPEYPTNYIDSTQEISCTMSKYYSIGIYSKYYQENPLHNNTYPNLVLPVSNTGPPHSESTCKSLGHRGGQVFYKF